MMLRGRKLKRDREAGLVFDWRKGHGSFFRYLIAFVISVFLCGALYSYFRIEEPEAAIPQKQGNSITVMNLDLEENRWLAELMTRKSPFIDPWEVRSDVRLNEQIEKAIGMITEARYVPELAPFVEDEEVSLHRGFPGANRVPAPEAVTVSEIVRVPGDWWIEFKQTDHPEGGVSFSMPWKDEELLVNSGETWGFLLGIEPSGDVISCEILEGRRDDPSRVPLMVEFLKKVKFPVMKKGGAVRWWKFSGVAVNRKVETAVESEAK